MGQWVSHFCYTTLTTWVHPQNTSKINRAPWVQSAIPVAEPHSEIRDGDRKFTNTATETVETLPHKQSGRREPTLKKLSSEPQWHIHTNTYTPIDTAWKKGKCCFQVWYRVLENTAWMHRHRHRGIQESMESCGNVHQEWCILQHSERQRQPQVQPTHAAPKERVLRVSRGAWATNTTRVPVRWTQERTEPVIVRNGTKTR